MSGDEVSVEVVVDDGAHGSPGITTVLRLSWRAEDPFAVGLQLSAQPDHPALPRGRWVVLRDFLHYGMEEPTGDGAVRIRPDEARDRVWLELAHFGRPACVSVPRETLRLFLAETEQAVPAGEERSEAAIEALLERLLQN